MRKRLPFIFLFGLFMCGLLSSASAQQSQGALVRVAHLSPNAPSVDIAFTSTAEDGETSTPEGLSGLAYETVSDYVELPIGEYTVSVMSEGNAVLEQDIFFDPGVSYTFSVMGLVLPEEDAVAEEDEGGFFDFVQNLFSGEGDRDALALQLLILRDNVDFVPVDGEPLVRVIHAAPGTEAVDLTIAGTEEREAVVTGVEFGGVSNYVPLRDGYSEPVLAIAGSDALTLDLSDISIEPGRVNTFIVTGTSLEQAPLKVIAVSDEPRPVPSPLTDTGAGGTVASVVANDPELATLTAALEQAGILEVLDGPGPFTLFAPNEAAFAAVPQDQLDAILADGEALQRVLHNHLVERAVTSFDIAGAGNLTSLDGADLEVAEAADGSLSVAGGSVATPDIEASNGVVHIIDTVLLPTDLELTEGETADPSAEVQTDTKEGAEASSEVADTAEQTEEMAEEATEEAAEESAEETQEATDPQTEEADEAEATPPADPNTLPPLQDTLVRVVHMSPNAPEVSVTLTDTTEGGETFAPEDLSALSYETSTDYLELAPGEYTISVTSDSNSVLEQTMFLDPGINYTLAVMGLVLPEEDTETEEDEGGFFNFIQDLFSGEGDRDALALQLLPLQDNVEFIAGEGETMLRLVHAAPGTGALELRGTTDGERETLVDVTAFGSVSGYATLSGNAEPAVTLAGSDALTLELSEVSFDPDTVTTLFVTGTSLEQAPLKVIALSGEPRPIPTALPATAVGGTIATIVFSDPDLIALSAALEQAGMLEVLDGPGPFTLFAPNAEAFSALPQDQLDALLADPEALTQVLNNHVINSVATSSDVADIGMLTTLDGVNLDVEADTDGNILVGDSVMVIPDIQASNGVIHIIDTVLLPEGLEINSQE